MKTIQDTICYDLNTRRFRGDFGVCGGVMPGRVFGSFHSSLWRSIQRSIHFMCRFVKLLRSTTPSVLSQGTLKFTEAVEERVYPSIRDMEVGRK